MAQLCYDKALFTKTGMDRTWPSWQNPVLYISTLFLAKKIMLRKRAILGAFHFLQEVPREGLVLPYVVVCLCLYAPDQWSSFHQTNEALFLALG